MGMSEDEDDNVKSGKRLSPKHPKKRKITDSQKSPLKRNKMVDSGSGVFPPIEEDLDISPLFNPTNLLLDEVRI